ENRRPSGRGRSIRSAVTTISRDQSASAHGHILVSGNAAWLEGHRYWLYRFVTFRWVANGRHSDQRYRKQEQMSRGATAMASNPTADWDALLRPHLQKTPDFSAKFLARLQTAKLTFGNRVHCPFLRPFFLSPEDEQRVRDVAETVAD